MRRWLVAIGIVLALAAIEGSEAWARTPAQVPEAETEFPVYGNDHLGDCTFAAAADWSIIRWHKIPKEQEIRLDFYEAGGQAHGGLSTEALFHWWAADGVAHHKEYFRTVPLDPASVENAVAHRHHALMAEVRFQVGEALFGWMPVEKEGYHMLVIDGYDASGPRIVTWGFQTGLSWAEWQRMAVGAWESVR